MLESTQMYVDELKTLTKIKPLKYPPKETPHITIEPNRTCNISCRLCYTLNKNFVKSLKDVKQEIDTAVKKRKIEIITLLGGEPTLHPDIIEIILYIKSKRLKAQLLTNGILLLQDKDGQFLDTFIDAGIDRILLHIDIGQKHVHGDIEEVRDKLFSILERKKVHFSLSLTIYEENSGEISGCLLRYSHYKFFDGILAILARDPFHQYDNNPELIQEYEDIFYSLKLEPSAYIPSSLDDKYLSWLIYFYFITTNNKIIFGVSPGVDRLLRKLYRVLKGKQLFSPIISQWGLIFLIFLIGSLEIINNPKKIRSLFRLVINSGLKGALRFHFIAIQTPPEFNQQKNQYQICYSCPDATIRNGKLTPVCIADQINPIINRDKNIEIQDDLYQTAYLHLGEIEKSP
jgi:hypothetical protein